MCAFPQVAHMNDCFFIQEKTQHFMIKKTSIHFIPIPIFTWMDKALQKVGGIPETSSLSRDYCTKGKALLTGKVLNLSPSKSSKGSLFLRTLWKTKTKPVVLTYGRESIRKVKNTVKCTEQIITDMMIFTALCIQLWLCACASAKRSCTKEQILYFNIHWLSSGGEADGFLYSFNVKSEVSKTS